jgi:hypothetical protein
MMTSGFSPAICQLLLGLQADDGLVQHDVVEHAAQGVAGLAGRSVTAASMASLMAMPRLPGVSGSWPGSGGPALVSVLGLATHLAAPGLHHQLAEGLLVEADAHHEHLALQAEQGAGERQGAAPLAGAGLGGQLLMPNCLL